MVFLLTDQSELNSFREGEAILKQCRELSGDLISVLAEFGNAWDIINNSTIGEFGSAERAPAIAAYSALFSLQAGLENIGDIMLAALLSDLGMVFLPPSISKKIRHDQMESFTPEEMEAFKGYPQQSLSVALDRKLSLHEGLRTTILSIHERADGNGFPKGIAADKLTIEPQMISFSREFDRRNQLRLGRPRVDPLEVRRQMIQEDNGVFASYSKPFLTLLANAFLSEV